MGVVCPLPDQLYDYIPSSIEGYELICLKIPLVSPLGLTEFSTKQGHFHPLYYYQVGLKAPLERLRAALHAIVVACI